MRGGAVSKSSLLPPGEKSVVLRSIHVPQAMNDNIFSVFDIKQMLKRQTEGTSCHNGQLESQPISTRINAVVPSQAKSCGPASSMLLNSLSFQNRMAACKAVTLGLVPGSYRL